MLLRLICWHFIYFKEVKGNKGGTGTESKHVGEVQIESEGLAFVFLLLEVRLGSPRGGIEMFKASKRSSFVIEMTVTQLWRETDSVSSLLIQSFSWGPSQTPGIPPPSDSQQRRSLSSYCGLCR